jgi:predicted O-methyltransferase YrrM
VQELLAALVAARPGGRIAEIGTAFGEGAAAMASTLPPDASLVTCDLDPERLEIARKRLADTRAEVIHGRWQDVLPARGPFDLIFFDGGGIDSSVLDLLAPGGILIKNDMTPGRAIKGDPVRELLLTDSRLSSVELLTTPTSSVIVAVRRVGGS